MTNLTWAALLCLLCLLSACGQTGNLVLPGTQPPPVETEVPDDDDTDQ